METTQQIESTSWRMAMIAIIAMLIANFVNAQGGASKQPANQQSIKTLYATKDWVISDFVVTDPGFGAKAEPGFDNRPAFQAAIDAAYNNGGGVVYIPAGNYEFRSTQTASRNVRVRQGTEQIKKDYNYQYVLNIPSSVQLRGDWADPELNDGKVLGTILEVRVGKNAPNYNGTVESWWNDAQAGNALRTTYTSIADRFIDMNSGTGVTNLSIWYPEQEFSDIKPYPWTLFQPGGDCVTVEHVTLVNAFNGFYSAPSELHYILNSYMTALHTGIEVHVCTDIGRIENVKIDPKYWANSGLPGSPSLAKATEYTRANGTGFNMHRSDWEYVSYLYVSGYKTGMWVGKEPGFSDTPNAQFYENHIKNCGTGLYVQSVNPYGLLISNSTFGADKDGNAVYFFNEFKTSVQFNGVDFTGPIVSDGSDGVISFESCTFSEYSEYALRINNGNALLTQCDFKKPAGHVFLGADVNTLKSVNSGYNRKLEIKNNSKSAKVEIYDGKKYTFEPIPKNIKTDIKVQPRPASNIVFKADLSRATGFNNDQPAEDVSAKLQTALNAVKEAGGGTLYLPGGRYLVNNPVKVPSGVELRGTWDVQHHTQSGGTGIFTTYAGGAAGEKGASLVQLEAGAGIRGITIAQLNIATDGFTAENPRTTLFLIQGQGPNIYIVNMTEVGDKGIDLASYNTSGHYVDYLGGVLARAGIWVGGGAEGGFIRNMQLNPHYGSRLPQGGQGYPRISLTRFLQSNCSALKFADIKNQTIFNNFVYGSFYGLHFLKDAITGKNPGKMTVIGHGSDGCSFSLFVEDAGKNTKLIAINSELVCTRTAEPVRSYVLMGREANTTKVHPDAQLILYNSAFWGSPVIGAIINSGTVRFQQANFQRSGAPGIDNRGGKAHVYSSYFAQKMSGEATGDNVYAKLHATGASIELTNIYYISGFSANSAKQGKIYGFSVAGNNQSNLPKKKPNVLILFADQHNKQVMGFEGHPDVLTPNLDKLARQSLVFDRAYCTTGICAPSRSSLMTGLYSRTMGLLSNGEKSSVLNDVVSLATLFQQNNYKTFAFGKRHTSGAVDSGWDVQQSHLCNETPGNSYTEWVEKNGYAKEFAQDWSAEFGKGSPCSTFSEEKIPTADLGTRISALPENMTMEAFTTQLSVQMIKDQVKSEKPFFCWATFYRPHQPYTPLKKYMDLYDVSKWGEGRVNGSSIRKPASLYEPKENIPPMMQSIRNGGNKVWNVDKAYQDEQLWRNHVGAYYALVTEVDHCVGEILKALDEAGIAEETIVIYTSDHGDFVGNHGMVEKAAAGQNVYEDILNIPLIIRYPGNQQQGKRSAELVSLVDIYPTLVDLLGLKLPKLKYPLQGQSFVRTLTKGKPMQRKYFVSESWSQATVITKDYKLGIMLDPTETQRKFDFRSFGDQFFVRRSDSLEIKNQITNDAYKSEIGKLRGYYLDFTSKIPDIGKQEVISKSGKK